MLEKIEKNKKELKNKKLLKKLRIKGEKRNMLRKMIKYIFIYVISVIFIGCDNPISTKSCDYCHLELEAPNLPMDENGIYHLDYNNGEIQTFTQLRAYIGYELEYVGWTTDTAFDGCTWDYCEDVPIVNGAGYSSEDGYSYQMIGVYEGNIGDIATIWVGYYDGYGNQWLDSIRIKIDE
jgi:hypothetical protein|tara:strand:- start:90 stop:626 length:537 start_codon:yes stop_codon:yes gene_type:complete